MFTIVVDSRGAGSEVTAAGFSGKVARERLLEGTDSRVRARLELFDEDGIERFLLACPVLWSPEHTPKDADLAFAYVGRFQRLHLGAREVQYTFKPYEGFAAIPARRLHELDDVFGFGEWGWHRTRIVAMEDDLIDLLGSEAVAPRPVAGADRGLPELFTIAPKRHDRLVCVMMPFTIAKLQPVFAKLDLELARLGIHCERADTDLSGRRVIDKVATLIYHADAVVCDFTGTNPNVFYEAGLAHGWSKTTIFIAERDTNLPFDTRDEATIIYDNTELGRKELWYQVHARLQAHTDLLPSA